MEEAAEGHMSHFCPTFQSHVYTSTGVGGVPGVTSPSGNMEASHSSMREMRKLRMTRMTGFQKRMKRTALRTWFHRTGAFCHGCRASRTSAIRTFSAQEEQVSFLPTMVQPRMHDSWKRWPQFSVKTFSELTPSSDSGTREPAAGSPI